MGQAFDRDGHVLGEATGDTKREVLDQLEKMHPDADEIRIRTLREKVDLAEGADRTAQSVRRGGMMDLKDKIEDLFTYHAPEGTQPAQYEAIRSQAKALAHVIVDNTPPSADQTAAIRK